MAVHLPEDIKELNPVQVTAKSWALKEVRCLYKGGFLYMDLKILILDAL